MSFSAAFRVFSIRATATRRLLFLLVALCCPASESLAVIIVAHRGGYALAPENTLAAFRNCADYVDWIEFDVHESADRQLVVIHDETVNRTATGFGAISNVASLTLAQLKAMEVGSKFSPAFAGEQIPTLAEILQSMPPVMNLILHIKSGKRDAILQVIAAPNIGSNVTCYSENWSLLDAIRQANPRVGLCAGIDGPITSNALDSIQSRGIRWVAAFPEHATPEALDLLHSRGMAIQIAASVLDMQSWIDKGVDRILVNDPRTASALVRSKRSSPSDLSRELVAYWQLDDGLDNAQASTAEDLEDRSSGLLSGFGPRPTWLTSPNSKMGGALHFCGSNQHVRLPSNPFLDIGTNAVSISLWVNLSTLPSQLAKTHSCIFDSEIDAYVMYLDRECRELRFKTTDSSLGAARPGIPESRLRTGTWLHVVGVYDGSASPSAGQTFIYLNGQLRDVHAGTDSSPRHGLTRNVRPGQRAAMGRNGMENDFYFAGGIDDVAVWRRALSPAEIDQIYQAGSSSIPLEELVMDIRFDAILPISDSPDVRIAMGIGHGKADRRSFVLRSSPRLEGPFVEHAIVSGANGRLVDFRIPAQIDDPNAPPSSTRFFQIALLDKTRETNRPKHVISIQLSGNSSNAFGNLRSQNQPE